MSERKTRYAVYVAIVFASALAICYVFEISIYKIFYHPNIERGEKLGTVKEVRGVLKMQAAHHLEFVKIKEGDEFYEDDTIMTGPQDSAYISLPGRDLYEVRPGTLLHLQRNGAIDDKPKPKVVVVERGRALLPDPTPGPTNVAAIAQKSTPQPPRASPQSKAPGKITKVLLTPPILQFPKQGSTISFSAVLKTKNRGLTFTWLAVRGAYLYQFELASDAHFKRIVKKSETGGTQIIVSHGIPLGPHYWRVIAVAKNASSDYSKAFQFLLNR